MKNMVRDLRFKYASTDLLIEFIIESQNRLAIENIFFLPASASGYCSANDDQDTLKVATITNK